MKTYCNMIQYVGTVIIFCSSYFRYFSDHSWALSNVVGLIMAFISYILWVIARIQLGDAFAVDAIAVRLVTTGIYRRFSHPIYTFSTTGIMGYVLLIGRPLWLLSLFVIIPIQIYRAKRESKVLHDCFGYEYEDYQSHVWF